MRTAKQIVADIKEHGTVNLGGEMAFPARLLIQEAKAQACRIAEECGYLVRYAFGCRSMLEVSGPGIDGFIILDWFGNNQEGPQKVEVWTAESAYTFSAADILQGGD